MVSLFDDYNVLCNMCGKVINTKKEHNHIIIQDLITGETTIENTCNACRDKVKKLIKDEVQKCLP